MNHKKLRRLYPLPRGTAAGPPPRRTQASLGHEGADGAAATAPQRWSLHFLSASLIDGRALRMLAIVDDFTRE